MHTITWLIYSDLDGTLLDHDTYRFDAASEMLIKLAENGHFVIPNTSKTYAELTDFQTKAGLKTPFIFENGAAVAIPKDFFPYQPPGTEDADEVWLKSFTHPRDHWLALLARHGNHFADLYTGFSQMTSADVVAQTGLSLAAAEMAMQRRFGEPLQWLGDKQSQREFANIMQSAGATVLQGGRFMHICGDTDKGKALTWLTKIFGRECPEQTYKTVALGDSGNDTAMLEAADVGVQIKSHSHEFPTINKKENIYRSTLYGPEGWSECLEKIIFNQEQ